MKTFVEKLSNLHQQLMTSWQELVRDVHKYNTEQQKKHREVVCDYIFMVVVIDGIISVLQQNRLQWYGHVLCKQDNDWVKKCIEFELEVPDQEVDQSRLGERLCK